MTLEQQRLPLGLKARRHSSDCQLENFAPVGRDNDEPSSEENTSYEAKPTARSTADRALVIWVRRTAAKAGGPALLAAAATGDLETAYRVRSFEATGLASQLVAGSTQPSRILCSVYNGFKPSCFVQAWGKRPAARPWSLSARSAH